MTELTPEQIADGWKSCDGCGIPPIQGRDLVWQMAIFHEGEWHEGAVQSGSPDDSDWTGIDGYRTFSPDLPKPKGEAVGWAYRDSHKDKWHLCADKPHESKNREVRPVFLHPAPASSLIRELAEALNGIVRSLDKKGGFLNINHDELCALLKGAQPPIDKARAYTEGR